MSATSRLRRAVPLTVLPLSLLACGLASSPWLRAYPYSVLAAPLFGAALLSVLLPFIVVNVGVRKLWQTVLIDLVGYLFFVTLVALREPLGYADVWSGLVHGPSQILSYALPLVSPRTLLVVPVTLCWLCGAVVGECFGRGWQSVLPYLTLIVTFGLSYAATERAVTNFAGGRRFDTMVGGALLLCLLLLRAVQAWVDQDTDAGGVQPEAGLPMRAVAVGTAVALLVAGAATLAVQSTAFRGHGTSPARTPPIASSNQLSPISFVAGLRPARAGQRGAALFTMSVDSLASRYVSIGDVDTYNGDGWSFTRTFRPSGGVVPADTDPSLRPKSQPIIQQYTITGAQLTASPWMPFEFRPQRVIGASVDIDPDSGMIVPSSALHINQRYSVTSDVALRTFDQLRPSAQPGTSYQAVDVQLPVQVTTSLPPVITAFEHETHTSSKTPVQFLQALAADLRSNYSLVGAGPPGGSATSSGPASSAAPSHSAHRSAHHRRRSPVHGHRPHSNPHPHYTRHAHHAQRPRPASSSPSAGRFAGVAPSPGPSADPTPAPSATPAPSSSQAAGGRPGGTSFAAVLASILGSSRTATPEQYATLVALIARQLNVPARVVTGFRLPTTGHASTVEPGTYTVTTGDAWTWVELPVQGQGWVVLDPSPAKASAPHSTPTGGARSTPRPTSSPPPATLVTQATSSGGIAVGHKGHVPRSHPVAVGMVIGFVLAGVGVLILIALVVAVVRKWLRVRRRRGAADPRLRVVGAWQETLDVLVESGLSDPRALSSAEVADATTEAFGPESGEQARYLGGCANRAIFSPASSIGTEDAEAAWGAHAALRRAVRSRLPLSQRLASGLRYHRTRRSPTPAAPSAWDATTRARARAIAQRSARHGTHRRRAH